MSSWSEFEDTQMLMVERSVLGKMTTEMLLDSTIKTEKSYWKLSPIRLQIQWAL